MVFLNLLLHLATFEKIKNTVLHPPATATYIPAMGLKRELLPGGIVVIPAGGGPLRGWFRLCLLRVVVLGEDGISAPGEFWLGLAPPAPVFTPAG